MYPCVYMCTHTFVPLSIHPSQTRFILILLIAVNSILPPFLSFTFFFWLRETWLSCSVSILTHSWCKLFQNRALSSALQLPVKRQFPELSGWIFSFSYPFMWLCCSFVIQLGSSYSILISFVSDLSCWRLFFPPVSRCMCILLYPLLSALRGVCSRCSLVYLTVCPGNCYRFRSSFLPSSF